MNGKRSIRENLRYLKRGYGLIWKLSPYLLIRDCAWRAAEALRPALGVYFSAAVLEGLTNRMEPQRLIVLTALMIGVNFILSVLIDALKSANTAAEELLYSSIQLYLGEAGLEFDFADIENPDTRILRGRIDEAMKARRGGLDMMYRRGGSAFGRFCAVLFSGILAVPLFTSVSDGKITGFVSFFHTPLSSVLLLLLILVLSLTAGSSFQTAARKLFEAWKGWPESLTKANYYMEEYTGEDGAAKDIRIFDQQSIISKELHRWFDNPPFLKSRLGINCKYDAINLTISTLLTGLVYFFVAMKVMAGSLGIGALVRYSGLAIQFISAVSVMSAEGIKCWRNNDYLEDVFTYLDLRKKKSGGNRRTEHEVKSVEFRNVSFCYPGSGKYALQNISICLKPASSYAVVGMNGSGKSTFIKLLCRLYEPTEGEIFLNGKNIREYEQEEYFRLISVVFQDFNLFSFSLGANVAASPGYDAKKVADCLDKAGFSHMEKKMTDGLETMLYRDFTSGGVEVSGGEAQKIAMARALYKNAPIMILDEPTAALDPVSEAEIYERFAEIVRGKMAVYISHRLSSCKFCDHILVFHEGRMVQRGTHEELVRNRDGQYFKLWNAQAQYYVR